MGAEKGSRFMRPGAIAPVTSASAGDRNLVAFLLTRNAATAYFVFSILRKLGTGRRTTVELRDDSLMALESK